MFFRNESYQGRIYYRNKKRHTTLIVSRTATCDKNSYPMMIADLSNTSDGQKTN